MSKNRHPVKQWFITFPQSEDVTKEEFVNAFPPRAFACAALEKHADGGNHLHLTMILVKGITFSNMVKWVTKKWPNDWKRIKVEACRSVPQSVDYCNKEDPDTLTEGTFEKKKKKVKTTKDQDLIFDIELYDQQLFDSEREGRSEIDKFLLENPQPKGWRQ